MVYLEKYCIELPESTKKLIEKSPEKYICCANSHRTRAGPFVDTSNKRSKNNMNLNSKTKPAADDGGKNDSDDEEVALTASAVADSDNDDFDEEKEDENEFGLLNPPPKILY